MLPERRRRLITKLWRLVVWPVAVLAAAVVGFSAYAVLGLAPLAPWHSLELKEEFEARRDAQLDFAGLLALEGRLFEELRRAKVLRSSDLAEERSSRFSPASWVARLTGAPGDAGSGDVYTAPYNRSFELVPAERRGSALLIHGLTDAPYSMLALARRLHARGLHVVVLRLPGHGTVPAGQLRMTLEDWRAAVRIAARHAASLASPDQPFYVGGYSTGGTLALTHALESLSDPTLRRPTRVLLVSPAIELPRIAVLTRIIDALAFLPGLEAAHWQEILPEYDPYKYNSFAVNSTRQVLAATNTLARAIDQAQAAGLLDKSAAGDRLAVGDRFDGRRQRRVRFRVRTSRGGAARAGTVRRQPSSRLSIPGDCSGRRAATASVGPSASTYTDSGCQPERRVGACRDASAHAWAGVDRDRHRPRLASQHRIGRPRRALLSARRSGLRVPPR